METALKEIVLMISNNELEFAFQKAEVVLKGHPKLDEILLQKPKFKDITTISRAGGMDFTTYSTMKQQITHSFLTVIREIQKENEAKTSAPANSEKELLQRILNLLHQSYDAFLTQINVRDKLQQYIYNRTNDVASTQYWEYFHQHYSDMTPIEKILHQRIRGYTKDLIAKYNFEILELLEQHPQLIIGLPRLSELQSHLSFWKSQYDNEFVSNPSISLVYLREHQKGFPTGIEAQIKFRMEQL